MDYSYCNYYSPGYGEWYVEHRFRSTWYYYRRCNVARTDEAERGILRSVGISHFSCFNNIIYLLTIKIAFCDEIHIIDALFVALHLLRHINTILIMGPTNTHMNTLSISETPDRSEIYDSFLCIFFDGCDSRLNVSILLNLINRPLHTSCYCCLNSRS